MTIRSSISLAAAGIASLLAIGSAQASPNNNMLGQSARAGTQSQADLRADYRGQRPSMSQHRYETAPAPGWNMQDEYQMERADRPDRQR
jgi:hypothetical protein